MKRSLAAIAVAALSITMTMSAQAVSIAPVTPTFADNSTVFPGASSITKLAEARIKGRNSGKEFITGPNAGSTPKSEINFNWSSANSGRSSVNFTWTLDLTGTSTLASNLVSDVVFSGLANSETNAVRIRLSARNGGSYNVGTTELTNLVVNGTSLPGTFTAANGTQAEWAISGLSGTLTLSGTVTGGFGANSNVNERVVFNAKAYQIEDGTGGPTPIPTPAASGAGLLGLSGLMLRRSR